MESHQQHHQPVSHVNTQPRQVELGIGPWLLYPFSKSRAHQFLHQYFQKDSMLYYSFPSNHLAFSSGFMWHGTVQHLKSVTRFNCGLLRIWTVHYNNYYLLQYEWQMASLLHIKHRPGDGRRSHCVQHPPHLYRLFAEIYILMLHFFIIKPRSCTVAWWGQFNFNATI